MLNQLRKMYEEQLKNHPQVRKMLWHPSDSQYTAVLPVDAVTDLIVEVAKVLLAEIQKETNSHNNEDSCKDCHNDCDNTNSCHQCQQSGVCKCDKSNDILDDFETFNDDDEYLI